MTCGVAAESPPTGADWTWLCRIVGSGRPDVAPLTRVAGAAQTMQQAMQQDMQQARPSPDEDDPEAAVAADRRITPEEKRGNGENRLFLFNNN